MVNHASRCRLVAGFVLGIATLLWCSLDPRPASAQTPAPEDQAAGQVFNFGVDKNLRMTVPVQIGSDGTYPFIVDTASTRTVIGNELAEYLNLPSAPSTRIVSLSDTKFIRSVIIPSLQVNGRTMRSVTAPVLTASNIGAAGIIGLDALKSQRVVVDFIAGTMAIASSSQPSDTSSSQIPENWEGEMIVVTGKSRLGQLVLADADVDGERVYVIIDTGGEVSMGNEALRRKLFGSKADGSSKTVDILSATGGTTVADYTTVDHLRIGGVVISNFPIAFADAHPFHTLDLTKQPALLIGMETLRLFDRITVDFAKRKVSFLWTGKGRHSLDAIR